MMIMFDTWSITRDVQASYVATFYIIKVIVFQLFCMVHGVLDIIMPAIHII